MFHSVFHGGGGLQSRLFGRFKVCSSEIWYRQTQNTLVGSIPTSARSVKSSTKGLESKLETWFLFKPQVLGYGESFGTIFRGPRLTWRSRTACTGCRRSRTSSWSNSASEQARDLIFFKPQVFGYGESFGTILRGPRLTWRSRTACMGCRRSRTASWSNFTSEHARDLGFFLNPIFFGMGNHLRSFSEPSDWPKGQAQPVQSVGGKGHLHGVTLLPER